MLLTLSSKTSIFFYKTLFKVTVDYSAPLSWSKLLSLGCVCGNAAVSPTTTMQLKI